MVTMVQTRTRVRSWHGFSTRAPLTSGCRSARVENPCHGWLAVVLLFVVGLAIPAAARAQEKKNAKPTEDDYYKIITIPIPDDIVLECGGLEVLPDGTLVVSTRRGDTYFVENANGDPPDDVKFTKWTTGMHEVMDFASNKKDGYLYAIQRGE